MVSFPRLSDSFLPSESFRWRSIVAHHPSQITSIPTNNFDTVGYVSVLLPLIPQPFLVGDRREAVRHIIIIGSPLGVRRTIHQLHAARYAEVARWTHGLAQPAPTGATPTERIAIPDDRIIITPEHGEIMSLLVKLIRLE